MVLNSRAAAGTAVERSYALLRILHADHRKLDHMSLCRSCHQVG
eukprot:COSAG06_NODE_60955_length_269_cov_0.611765_1_plen_43_part_10